MTPWLLTFGIAVLASVAGYWLGLKVGFAEGFQRGVAFAEEALVNEETSIASLCAALGTTRDELGPALAESLQRIESLEVN